MFGGTFSILHWIVVLAVVLLLFGGRGKVSAIMGDFGKGLRNFKTGLKGSEEEVDAEAIEENVLKASLHSSNKYGVKNKMSLKMKNGKEGWKVIYLLNK